MTTFLIITANRALQQFSEPETGFFFSGQPSLQNVLLHCCLNLWHLLVSVSGCFLFLSSFLCLHLLMCHSHSSLTAGHDFSFIVLHFLMALRTVRVSCSGGISETLSNPGILEMSFCGISACCTSCRIACCECWNHGRLWSFSLAVAASWSTRTTRATTGILVLSQMVWPYGLRSPVLINHAKTSERTEVATVPAGTLWDGTYDDSESSISTLFHRPRFSARKYSPPKSVGRIRSTTWRRPSTSYGSTKFFLSNHTHPTRLDGFRSSCATSSLWSSLPSHHSTSFQQLAHRQSTIGPCRSYFSKVAQRISDARRNVLVSNIASYMVAKSTRLCRWNSPKGRSDDGHPCLSTSKERQRHQSHQGFDSRNHYDILTTSASPEEA